MRPPQKDRSHLEYARNEVETVQLASASGLDVLCRTHPTDGASAIHPTSSTIESIPFLQRCRPQRWGAVHSTPPGGGRCSFAQARAYEQSTTDEDGAKTTEPKD